MANEEQLSILRQGVKVWNEWLAKFPYQIDLSEADLQGTGLRNISFHNSEKANLQKINLSKTNLSYANLSYTDLEESNLSGSDLYKAVLSHSILRKGNLHKSDCLWALFGGADLSEANLNSANLAYSNLFLANLTRADFTNATLEDANLNGCILDTTNFSETKVGTTMFGGLDLSKAVGLEYVKHSSPSTIGADTYRLSKGNIPTEFLRGCGLSDWEIESVKLYNPDLSNDEIVKIQYRIYELRATHALQISPLFISYSHGDGLFVDKLEKKLNKKGIRFWRDIYDMKSGRIEKQIDRAMRLNPTVLLILSKESLQSDWVEHEVRTSRALEKETKRDILCPVALDDSWKNSPWAKRIMDQIMEYNILNFSEWQDDTKFESTFNKLIDGLELFYK